MSFWDGLKKGLGIAGAVAQLPVIEAVFPPAAIIAGATEAVQAVAASHDPVTVGAGMVITTLQASAPDALAKVKPEMYALYKALKQAYPDFQ